jgi:hypothetical protein
MTGAQTKALNRQFCFRSNTRYRNAFPFPSASSPNGNRTFPILLPQDFLQEGIISVYCSIAFTEQPILSGSRIPRYHSLYDKRHGRRKAKNRIPGRAST